MQVYNIEDLNYEGYFWKSNEMSPTVLIDERFEENLDPKKNPFIIEALLYCKEKALSYYIKYVDGAYVIQRWDNVRDEQTAEYTQHEYYGNQVKDNESNMLKLRFVRHWGFPQNEEQENDGFSQLQPQELIFVGFKK